MLEQKPLVSAIGSATPADPAVSAWWRTHQLALMAMYIVASTVAWQIKESYPSRAALWLPSA